MFKFLGACVGLASVYFMISGAIVAYAKTNMDSSDYLVIGVGLMMVSQLLTNINVKDNKDQPTLP